MRKLLLSMLLTLSAWVGAHAEWDITSEKAYYITCDHATGYLALGSQRNLTAPLVYDTNISAPTDDAYWMISGNEEDGYTICNMYSGEYLAWCDEYDISRRMATVSEDDGVYTRWEIENQNSYVVIRNKGQSTYVFDLRSSAIASGIYRVGTYVKTTSSYGNNEHYHIYDAEGNEITWTDNSGSQTQQHKLTRFYYTTDNVYIKSDDLSFSSSLTVSTAPSIDGYLFSYATPSLPHTFTSDGTISFYYDPAATSYNTSETITAATDNYLFRDWTSNNQNQSSTTSTHTITFNCKESCKISFDWSVSSEASYDKLSIKLDGSYILQDKSGTDSGKYVSPILSAGTHTLVFSYAKDSSVDSGNDQAKASSIALFYSKSEGEQPNINLTTIEHGQFAQNTQWYKLTIRGNKQLYTSGSSVLCKAESNAETDPAFLWCFTQDESGYYHIYNMSAGAAAPYGSKTINNNEYILMDANNVYTAISFTQNQYGGYNFQIEGSNACANDVGSRGELRYWNNTAAPYDYGSNITFELVGEVSIQEIESLTLSKRQYSLQKNDQVIVAYSYTPADAALHNVVWSSSNAEVAYVDSNGFLNAVGGGTCTIRISSAYNDAIYDECSVSVIDPDMETWLEHSDAYYYVLRQNGSLIAIPQDFVSSYEQNGNQLTLHIKDASPLSYNDVSSFGEQVPVELPAFTSYKFNNKFNYQVFTDVIAPDPAASEINLSVGGIGKRLTASFQLPDDQTFVWVGEQLQESKETRLRFDKPVTYTIGRRNWKQMAIKQLSDGTLRTCYMPFGRHTTVTIDWLSDHSSNTYKVPEVYINTENSVYITSKSTYFNATIEINGGGVFPDLPFTSMQIRGRGNTSWGGGKSKDPYRMKFESGVKPLGMKKGKSWILLANKIGGSMTTNALGHKIASLMECDGQIHIVPVELYLNGKYQGSYNLCEKLGFSGNSIDLEDDSYAGMVELDTYSDTGKRTDRSNAYGIATKVHDPDVEESTYTGPLTYQGIIDDFNRMVHYVSLKDGSHLDYVSKKSVASYLATCELAAHSELMHPKSVFMYSENVTDDLDPTGKDPTPWHCGPYWDCDWAFGYQQGHNYYQVSETDDFFSNMIGSGSPKQFWNDLRYAVKDSESDIAYYKRWHKFIEEGGLDELLEYCDDYYDFAEASLSHNPQGEFAYDSSNYAQVTQNSKEWLRTRARHIYSAINAYELAPKYAYGDTNGDGQITLADLALLIDILLERQQDTYGTADANDDGIVNQQDVEFLLNEKLMKTEP